MEELETQLKELNKNIRILISHQRKTIEKRKKFFKTYCYINGFGLWILVTYLTICIDGNLFISYDNDIAIIILLLWICIVNLYYFFIMN